MVENNIGSNNRIEAIGKEILIQIAFEVYVGVWGEIAKDLCST